MEMILNMPNNYLELEDEEMMYLDGGWSITISATKCNRIAAVAAMGAGLAGTVGGILGLASCGLGASIAAVVAGIASLISGYFWLAGSYNGVKVTNGIPDIIGCWWL